MTARCTRAAAAETARVGQPGLAALLDDEAHLAGCEDCQAALAVYRRMTAAIGELSQGARRRDDHVARALATAAAAAEAKVEKDKDEEVAIRSPHQRWRRVAGAAALMAALAAAIALGWWLRRGAGPEELAGGNDGGAVDGAAGVRLAFEVVAKDGPALRGDAQLGDTLRVTAGAGMALWVYRNDRELLLVCPRDCRRQGQAWIGEVALDAVGAYQLVWLSTDAVPAPSGELERDVAAARAAGATHELRDLDVR